jgi:hypothetical protein
MNMDNLEQLSSFLQEEIFFIPEDRKAVLEKLESIAPLNFPKTQIPDTGDSSPEIIQEKEEIYQTIEAEPIPVRGKFSNGILLVHEESELNSELMDMLVKMINACGHSMSEVGLVSSYVLENRTMDEFLALNAHVIIKFGRIKHIINALPAHLYEIHTEDETEYLFADSLSMISEDQALKRKLWNALQKLFKLST